MPSMWQYDKLGYGFNEAKNRHCADRLDSQYDAYLPRTVWNVYPEIKTTCLAEKSSIVFIYFKPWSRILLSNLSGGQMIFVWIGPVLL